MMYTIYHTQCTDMFMIILIREFHMPDANGPLVTIIGMHTRCVQAHPNVSKTAKILYFGYHFLNYILSTVQLLILNNVKVLVSLVCLVHKNDVLYDGVFSVCL
jgi:hypothetical protein